MATSVTDRLGLKMQANGDNPGAWEVDLNQGFLDADAAFFKSGTGDPDGVIESDYIGQRFLDTATNYWYTATSVGAGADWVSDFLTIDADVVHPPPPDTYYTFGMLLAQLQWVSNTGVRLAPILGNVIYIDIDIDGAGVRKTLEHTGILAFDIVTDHHGAAETSSQANYLYVDDDDDDGVLTVNVSAAAPDDIGGTKPGYHSAEPTWRCVGSFWNDENSDITKFKAGRDGEIIFDGPTRATDHIHAFATLASQSALRTETVNIPACATSFKMQVLLEASSEGGGGYCVFAQDDAVSTGLLDTNVPIKITDAPYVEADLVLQSDTNDVAQSHVELNVVTRAAPAFKYGHNKTSPVTYIEAVVRGYKCLWTPKGF